MEPITFICTEKPTIAPRLECGICIYVVLLIVDKYTDLRVKVVKGTPSLVLHIRAEPSVDVEAKNSESRLEHGIT